MNYRLSLKICLDSRLPRLDWFVPKREWLFFDENLGMQHFIICY